MASTPTLDRFLGEISQILERKDAVQLQQYLIIEPPYSDLYKTMINDVRNAFPNESDQDALESKISNAIPLARNGESNSPWTSFIKFMVQYFFFLKDVNIDNLLDTYNLMSELMQYGDINSLVTYPLSLTILLNRKCNAAFVHPTLGIILLPTVIAFSKVLARLAIGLDKTPALIRHLRTGPVDESGTRETLPERCANVIRQAFVTCLGEKTSSANGLRDGKPVSKKAGIYKLANLCLKVLFQCQKTENAATIFTNIYNQSPPLAAYPRSERVTYLWYLGRFNFAHGHFYRAQICLGTAYAECHKDCLSQRRVILIYLIASNIILGRFPTQALYERPEARGLAEKFQPICKAISTGNLAMFRYLLDWGRPDVEWFIKLKLLLHLQFRLEILVLRSMMRKCFLLKGNEGDADARKAPTLDLVHVMDRAQLFEKAAVALITARKKGTSGAAWESWVFGEKDPPVSVDYVDPEFRSLPASELSPAPILPDMLQIESWFSSLINQGFLNGFVSHRLHRFAIQGVKRKGGALAAGFPSPWQVIRAKADTEVPGWKKQGSNTGMQNQTQAGPGMTIHLSGARPAGVGP